MEQNNPRLSWPDRWLAIQALFLLQTFALALRWYGLNRIYRWIERGSQTYPRSNNDTEQDSLQAAHVGKVVRIANQRIDALQVTCLPESLTVCYILHRKLIPAQLRMGVRKLDDDSTERFSTPTRNRFDGHAWVEVAGQVVSGDPDQASKYTIFDSHK